MAQRLFLIRHGIAEERHPHIPDEQRALTPKGQQRTQKVAQRLMALGVHFDDLQTSPLLRAHQTAEILHQTGLVSAVQITEHLRPQGSWRAGLEGLQAWRQTDSHTLALVGHEPNLSEWAERLIWGQPRQQLLLKKAGMIGLLLPEHANLVGHCTLFGLVAPKWLL